MPSLNIWPFNIKTKKLEVQKKKKKKIILFSLIGTILVLGGGTTAAVLLLLPKEKYQSITFNNFNDCVYFTTTHSEFYHYDVFGYYSASELYPFFCDNQGHFYTNKVFLMNLALSQAKILFTKLNEVNSGKMELKWNSKKVEIKLLETFGDERRRINATIFSGSKFIFYEKKSLYYLEFNGTSSGIINNQTWQIYCSEFDIEGPIIYGGEPSVTYISFRNIVTDIVGYYLLTEQYPNITQSM